MAPGVATFGRLADTAVGTDPETEMGAIINPEPGMLDTPEIPAIDPPTRACFSLRQGTLPVSALDQRSNFAQSRSGNVRLPS